MLGRTFPIIISIPSVIVEKCFFRSAVLLNDLRRRFTENDIEIVEFNGLIRMLRRFIFRIHCRPEVFLSGNVTRVVDGRVLGNLRVGLWGLRISAAARDARDYSIVEVAFG